jgi:hypothetical protein
MSDPRLQTLLASGELREEAASDDEVSLWWQKAIRAYSDGKHSTVSPDGSIRSLYAAARLAATCIVRESGYEVASRDHHFKNFLVATYVVAEGDLRTLLTDANAELRTTRRDVEYGFEEWVDSEAVEESRALVADLLNLAANHLREARPAIKRRIKKVR